MYEDVITCSCPEILCIGLPLLAVCFNQVGQCGSHVYEYIDNITVAILPCRHITRTPTHCRGQHHQKARLCKVLSIAMAVLVTVALKGLTTHVIRTISNYPM